VSILRDLFGPGTWGTGGNLVAWVICGVLGVIGTYLLRHRIGRNLAVWWNLHHREHAVEQHLEALRRHEASKREDGTT